MKSDSMADLPLAYQRPRDQRQQPVHALRQRLHDKVITVPIDDE